MKKPHHFSTNALVRSLIIRVGLWIAFLLLHALLTPCVRANVYATNVRLNGSTSNTFVVALTNLNINYILNEPATAGVTIKITSGATTIRTITLTHPNPGTLAGANAVVWDGKNDGGIAVEPGTYGISITASATGYEDWTQISDDGNLGNYVWEARGIAVNKNPASPYYGRVFVANSSPGPNDPFSPGDAVGMQKLNADGSPAEEGVFSDGGWDWAGDTFSPWKIEIAADDKVYISDQTGGAVLSFDQTLSSNSRRVVLTTNNYPAAVHHLSGPFITGSGTNTQIWIADTSSPGSLGIRRWQLGTNSSAATNDLGVTIVQAGSGSDLNLYPYDVAVDASNRIYTIQSRMASGDPAYRVFRFPAYTGTPELTSDWKIGNQDDSMEGAYGIAVDTAARYVAVAFIGSSLFDSGGVNGTRVFESTNGTPVVTLTPVPFHKHTDVAWDNVGNLYTTDNSDALWRAYSPPGTNQATTAVVVTIQIATVPLLTGSAYVSGHFQFTLSGQANASYVIQASTNLQDWTAVATNTSANATRSISLSAPSRLSFYRAVLGP